MITKAIKGDMHSYRQVIAFIRDEDMAHALFHEIAPLYEDRPAWLPAHPQARPACRGQCPYGARAVGVRLFDPEDQGTGRASRGS